MGTAVEVVQASGSIAGGTRLRKSPGPGMFVSRDGRWYPMLVPETKMERDQINGERFVDVIVLGANGKPIMHLDTAALKTIHEREGETADSLPATAYPDPQKPMNDLMAKQDERLEKFMQTMAEVTGNQNRILEALVQAVGSKKEK